MELELECEHEERDLSGAGIRKQQHGERAGTWLLFVL